MLSDRRMIAEVRPSLPPSHPPTLPPSCPSEWVSSPTGVIELAVTDSAALSRRRAVERVERATHSLWLFLVFWKCRWFLVLNNVLSAGCYLQRAKIEMYCCKEVLNVLFFSPHGGSSNISWQIITVWTGIFPSMICALTDIFLSFF